MRISRADTPVVFDENHKVEIGKGVVVREGGDATIVGNGVMLPRCLEAAGILEKEGINCKVINLHTVKPIDEELLREAAEETGAIVTAEEHSVIGGVGSAVCEVLGESMPVPVVRVGIHDTFAETALNFESLLDAYGMAVEDVVKAAKLAIQKKERNFRK